MLYEVITGDPEEGKGESDRHPTFVILPEQDIEGEEHEWKHHIHQNLQSPEVQKSNNRSSLK